MTVTHDDVQRILKIIDGAEHVEEIDIAYGEFRLHVRRHALASESAAPAMASRPIAVASAPAFAESITTPAPVAVDPAKSAEKSVPEGMVAVRAPMLGTFYRAPSPGEKPFVEVGQQVKATDTVCLIEVMKLFNSITAGVDGKVAEILIENAELVEFRQIVILIEPKKK